MGEAVICTKILAELFGDTWHTKRPNSEVAMGPILMMLTAHYANVSFRQDRQNQYFIQGLLFAKNHIIENLTNKRRKNN